MTKAGFDDDKHGLSTLACDATRTDRLHAVDSVDLAEALRLLTQAGIHVLDADRAGTLQQVIDGLCTLSSRDGLTGLANRGMFNEALEREIDRNARTGEIFALLLVDIDHFKQTNDRHGHFVGDLVLKAVARMIKNSFRSIDTVARFGGEEFAVVLPGTPEAFVARLAERVRARIANAPIEATPGVHVGVTVSLGAVCSRGQAPLDARVLIEAADRKLYEAKRLGRNRVCCESVSRYEVTLGERTQLLNAVDALDNKS